jgi:hypothetical protein
MGVMDTVRGWLGAAKDTAAGATDTARKGVAGLDGDEAEASG